jgi:splicing factor 3B subunit 5
LFAIHIYVYVVKIPGRFNVSSSFPVSTTKQRPGFSWKRQTRLQLRFLHAGRVDSARAHVMAATQQDKFDVNTQNEHLASKYVGTGHANTTRFEWASTIKRDTSAAIVANHSLAAYQALAMNESIGRVKYQQKQSMLMPCGIPPVEEDGVNN